jgi:hypothetical protein
MGKMSKRKSSRKMYANPFFNFLRTVKEELKGRPINEVAEEAGRRWRRMTYNEKLPFIKASLRRRRTKKTDLLQQQQQQEQQQLQQQRINIQLTTSFNITRRKPDMKTWCSIQ